MATLTKAQCYGAAAQVVRAYGFRNFADLYELVIWKGAIRAGYADRLATWRRVERAFHTAQMLRWAAEECGEARAYWLGVAAKRLGACSMEQWRDLPEEIRRAA